MVEQTGVASKVRKKGSALDGIRAQLTTAVTSDGLWFEGENYHFFALRGF